jgi:hypothetical protein
VENALQLLSLGISVVHIKQDKAGLQSNEKPELMV